MLRKVLKKKLLHGSAKNPKQLFSYVNKQQAPKSPMAIKSNAGLLTGPHEVASELNLYFKSVFQKPVLPLKAPLPLKGPFTPILTISRDMVYNHLSALNAATSSGPDNHHPALLKNCADTLALPLSIIYSLCVKEGTFPESWKLANVVPIHKNGPTTNASNYRPISLLSVISKIFEKILHEYLSCWLNSNSPISDSQHGFRKGKSCLTNLLTATEHWASFLEDKNACDVIYFDLAKAFDSVPHDILLTKLSDISLPPFLYSILYTYLLNRKQRVRVGSSYSPWAPVTSGVPQGSVLGPLLFLIFINDLPDVISALCLLFADDLKIYRCVNNRSDAESLQNDVSSILNWATKNGLKINEKKCQVLHLGSNNLKFTYKLNNTPIPQTLQAKDLGIIIDSNLKFHAQALAASAKARKVGNYLLKYLSFINCDTLKILINSFIRPHLEYCIQAWRPFYHKSFAVLERTFRSFTKRCPETASLPYPERLKVLGLRSLQARFDRGDLLQTFKIVRRFDQLPFNLFFSFATYQKTRGHSYKLCAESYRTNTRKGSFSQRVVLPWNQLPSFVVEAPSVAAWKAAFDRSFP